MHCHRFLPLAVLIVFALAPPVHTRQPPVADGPGGEPNWRDILRDTWDLDLLHDLRNPLQADRRPAALFKRANPNRPVVFRPIIALGLESTTRGGWYGIDMEQALRSDRPAPDPAERRHELWRYAFKPSEDQLGKKPLPAPPLENGKTEFDPKETIIGFWVSNDNFADEVVHTDVEHNLRHISRFKDQPYKVMIYPNIDPATGRMIPDSYILGWEYSTNDDFQDVVTIVENVRLLPGTPQMPEVIGPDVEMRKLAGDFVFTEGPAWSMKHNALYFSDIPPAHIYRYKNGETSVAVEDSQQANGLMFDAEGRLIACEHAGRRISRRERMNDPEAESIVSHYGEKKLNSPNDLWLDAHGGIYFTDPRYGSRDTMEMEIEGVYYVDADHRITRIIDDLVKPNGIALSTDGRQLYVLDNGGHALHQYEIKSPGKIGKGKRIAHVAGPDGMTVDRQGRLYVTVNEGVAVLGADGRWLGVISVPERPANCTFGGEKLDTLFITARKGLYSIRTQTRGWHVHLDGIPKQRPAADQ